MFFGGDGDDYHTDGQGNFRVVIQIIGQSFRDRKIGQTLEKFMLMDFCEVLKEIFARSFRKGDTWIRG